MYLTVLMHSIVEWWRLNIQKYMERFRYLRNYRCEKRYTIETKLQLRYGNIGTEGAFYTVIYRCSNLCWHTNLQKNLCYTQMNFTYLHNSDICIFILISFNISTKTSYVLLYNLNLSSHCGQSLYCYFNIYSSF